MVLEIQIPSPARYRQCQNSGRSRWECRSGRLWPPVPRATAIDRLIVSPAACGLTRQARCRRPGQASHPSPSWLNFEVSAAKSAPLNSRAICRRCGNFIGDEDARCSADARDRRSDQPNRPRSHDRQQYRPAGCPPSRKCAGSQTAVRESSRRCKALMLSGSAITLRTGTAANSRNRPSASGATP